MTNTSDVKILIVEDEPLIAEDISEYLQELGYRTPAICHTVETALKEIKREKPHLVLLDINLEQAMNGIDLGRILNEDFHIPFIYLTAHYDNETLEDAKSTRPEGYLVKPIDEKNLQSNIEIALHRFSSRSSQPEKETSGLIEGDSFYVKVKNKLKKVQVEDILWAEACDNYAYIQTANEKYLLSTTLKNISSRLPESLFVRIHRSYVINLEKITAIEGHTAWINEKSVPISNRFKAQLMERIKLI